MSYKPRKMPLLTAAQQNQGWDTVTGVEVLLTQAPDQFLLWMRLELPREIMEVTVVLIESRLL
ncbi:3-dehydroquinate synthase AroB [Penicillium roqueforti FM164]|uniref:3-dehydroquinate synthase AroB n=1 Tax=Penicillium roqueforti (strain FM164) TaxID=1365484 RepID=W6QML7_PENRF|nr:3-dehydroquinate synthase AroB [Penicillium roqueforti FM164]